MGVPGSWKPAPAGHATHWLHLVPGATFPSRWLGLALCCTTAIYAGGPPGRTGPCTPALGDTGDFDSDRVVDSCDNCQETWNPAQTNRDGDTLGDACDLNDGVIHLTFPNRDLVSWQPEVGYARWNWYRGDIDVLRETGAYIQGQSGAARRICGIPETSWPDTYVPAPGKMVFHLTSGTSNFIEGGLGTDGAGHLRPMDLGCDLLIFAMSDLVTPPVRSSGTGSNCVYDVEDWVATFENMSAWNTLLQSVRLDDAVVTYQWDNPAVPDGSSLIDLGSVVVAPGSATSVSFAPIEPADLAALADGGVASVEIEFHGRTADERPVSVHASSLLHVPAGCAAAGCTTEGPCFLPDAGEAPDTMSMAAAGTDGGVVGIDVRVTDVEGVYGAAFRLGFDPEVIGFDGWEPGSLLEEGGVAIAYLVTPDAAGSVTVGASRLGPVAGADANGSETLLRIKFRALGLGTSPILFVDHDLFDSNAVAIPGLEWNGGFVASN